MKKTKRIMIWILVIAAGTFILFGSVGYFISAPVYKGPKAENFDGQTFQNSGGVKAKGTLDVLKWMVNRERGSWYETANFEPGEKPPTRVEGEACRVTFVTTLPF